MANILLVVASAGSPTTGDALLKTLLESIGHTVTYRSDESSEDITGMDGVVISESCSSATIAAKYTTVAIPVVSNEDGNWDDLSLTDGAPTNVTRDSIEINEPSHPIADGPHGTFSGSVVVLTSVVSGGMKIMPPNYASGGVQVARVNTSSVQIMAVDSGGSLISGTAPAKRAVFGIRELGMAALNTTGENLLKNIFAWAFTAGGTSVEDTLDTSASSTQSLDEEIIFPGDEAQHVTTSTQTLAEADAESLSSSAIAYHGYSGAITTGEEYSAVSTQTILEDITFEEPGDPEDTLTNSATSTHTLAESILFAEDPMQNIGSSTQSLVEASLTEEEVSNSASSTQSILSADVDSTGNAGTGSQTAGESISESVANSAASAQSLVEESLTAETLDNAGTGTQTMEEEFTVSENDLQNVGTNLPTIQEAGEAQETISNAASSTQDISDADTDDLSSVGAATIEIDEEIYLPSDEETLTNVATGSQSLLEEAVLIETPLQNVSESHLSIEEESLTEETVDSSATSSQSVDETITVEDDLLTAATSTQTIDEDSTYDIPSEDSVNVAISTQTIDEEAILFESPLQNVGVNLPSISEESLTLDTLDTTSVSSQNIEESLALQEVLVTDAQSTQSIAESEIVAPLQNAATSTQTISETIGFSGEETFDNVGVATHTILDAIGDEVTPPVVPVGGDTSTFGGGSFVPTIREEKPEQVVDDLVSVGVADFFIDEQIERVVLVETIKHVERVQEAELSDDKPEPVTIETVKRIELSDSEAHKQAMLVMSAEFEESMILLREETDRKIEEMKQYLETLFLLDL